jgi:hypothetical protein
MHRVCLKQESEKDKLVKASGIPTTRTSSSYSLVEKEATGEAYSDLDILHQKS